MADSNYFNGQFFRTIDDSAAVDNKPLTAPLEGQLTNNVAWMHTYGGGQSLKAYRSGNNWAGNDLTFYSSVRPMQIHHQPFLMSRGLTRIDITISHRVTLTDVTFTVEVGALPEVSATIPVSANHIHTVLRVYIRNPVDVEYFTDLTIYSNTTLAPGSTSVFPDEVKWVQQGVLKYVEAGIADVTQDRDAALVLSPGEDENTNLQWLYVDHAMKNVPGASAMILYMNNDYNYQTGFVSQVPLSIVNIRSIQVDHIFG